MFARKIQEIFKEIQGQEWEEINLEITKIYLMKMMDYLWSSNKETAICIVQAPWWMFSIKLFSQVEWAPT